jgi:hypothetical protein
MEASKKLVDKAQNVPESLFGAHPKMKLFTEADEAWSHERLC